MFTLRGTWILMLLLLVITGVVATTDSLTELGRSSNSILHFSFLLSYPTVVSFFKTENVAGKLVFSQMEGNATRVRDTGKLASDVPTQTMLELLDPQMNFSNTTKFAYTWDLGNG